MVQINFARIEKRVSLLQEDGEVATLFTPINATNNKPVFADNGSINDTN